VTFLFTDVEGSTRMWERNPSVMQKALSRHDEILSSAIEANGGYVFKTVGDAFCAAFSGASEALGAALEGQRTLLAERYEAVRLFVERGQDAKAGFALTEANAPVVAEICVRLDGLPLAIELAAARVKILPPEAMLGRIANRLKLLKGGARDLPERQRTLRGAIDWSHDLLSEEERTLFRRLSVFAGGRTLEAIEGVCDPEGKLDALEGVESMVDKSLIRQEEGAGGEPRFVMLETIHEYAREKLEGSREPEEIKRLHAAYFLALAEEAEPELVGPDQIAWMDRLETEHDNMRSALSWALGSGRIDTALRLGGALEWFWKVRGHFVEGGRWLEETLSADEDVPDIVRAKALCSAGYLADVQGDIERARRLLQESLALYRELGDEERTARSLQFLGWTDREDIERARRLLEESLEINRRVGSKRELAMVLHSLAVHALDAMTVEAGEQERMKALFEESEALYRESGDIQGLSASPSSTCTVGSPSNCLLSPASTASRCQTAESSSRCASPRRTSVGWWAPRGCGSTRC
jgi:tetratricopeptide (TPR) repeat protein